VLIVAAFCFLLAARFSRFSRSLSLAKNSQALESWRAIRFRFRFPFRFASIVQMFHYLTDFSWPAKPTQPAVCCGPTKAHGNRRAGDNFAFEIPTKIPRCCHQLSCLVCKCRGFGLLFTPERTLLGRIGQGLKMAKTSRGRCVNYGLGLWAQWRWPIKCQINQGRGGNQRSPEFSEFCRNKPPRDLFAFALLSAKLSSRLGLLPSPWSFWYPTTATTTTADSSLQGK